jgi:NAD(P)H-hydrate repair Nnr-like enzyme with NAD(P)H-hydrate epimerase domain
VERHRKAMGLKDGAQQLMEQQQQAVAEAARAKASLAAATERMTALVPAHDKDGDVFESVEAELQGLRRQVEALQLKMKRTSMEEKITARQQELDQQLQTSAAATSPTPSKATIPAPLSPSEAAAMAAAAQVFNRFFVAVSRGLVVFYR